MKIIKYIFTAIFVLVVIAIGAGIFFVYTFDANSYKEIIVEKTKEATGRDLMLAGDIDVSLFPWLGFSLGSTQFGNAAGFGDAPMASVDEVDVRVAFLPLLKGEVQAAKVKLHGLKMNLQKNSKGVTNWDDLAKESESVEEQKTDPDTKELNIVINGIEITDAEVLWHDAQAGSKIQIAPLNLTTGEIGTGESTDVDLDVNIKNSAPVLNAALQLSTKANFDSKAQTLQLAGLDMNLNASGEPFPNGSLMLRLESDVSGNFKTQKYSLNNTNIKISGTGDAFPEGKLDAELQTAIDADLAKEFLNLSSLVVSMLDTKLTGNASVQSFDKPKVKFSLSSDELDLDKMLPTSSAEEKAQSTPADENEPIQLPTESLRDLNVHGDINIGSLKISGLTMTNVKATITANNGLLQVTPMSMNLYDGTMKGKASVDVRGKMPKYAMATDLNGVQIEKLSVDFLGEKKAYMRGVSNLTLDVHTTGNSVAELKRALGGKAKLDAGDGALRDKKLAANVEKAAAFLKGREPKPTGEEIVFDKLFGTFNISNGLSDNKDFKLDTPLVFAKGIGKVDIGQSKTDYTISIGLSEEPDKCGVPVTIKGPFEKLSYGIDIQTALKCAQAEKIAEKKQELQEKLDEKIQEEIGDKLGEDIGKQIRDKLKLF